MNVFFSLKNTRMYWIICFSTQNSYNILCIDNFHCETNNVTTIKVMYKMVVLLNDSPIQAKFTLIKQKYFFVLIDMCIVCERFCMRCLTMLECVDVLEVYNVCLLLLSRIFKPIIFSEQKQKKSQSCIESI